MFKEIKATSLYYIYDWKTSLEKVALANINTVFRSDEILAITGETGSGKSTLAQNLNALLIPTKGILSYPDGITIDRTPKIDKKGREKLGKPKKIKEWKAIRRMVAISFQFPEDQLFKNTVLEDVMVGPINLLGDKKQAERNAKEALQAVHLSEGSYYVSPLKLSGGDKRKVSLAGALACDPDFLILDEPTVGLDYRSSLSLMKVLQEMNERGIGILLITHDMEIAYRYCQRLLYLEKGKLIKEDAVENIFKDTEFVQSKGLHIPEVFRYASYLESQGFPIDYKKAKDAEGLAKEIKRVIG